MKKPLYLGIDLGTTNSVAALFDGDKVEIVRNAQGAQLTPSVVRVDARGNVTVGAKARKAIESDPANTRSEFKRLMGTGQSIEFPAAKGQRRPEELSALVLEAMRADTRDQCGFEPARAVVTVPALFELPQNAATSEAARLAGFERVELLQEPVASALAAGWSAADATGSWLVYDLGGGTFDVSLLETREGLLRVVGHDGDNFLGGRDIDNALVDWALAELAAERGLTISRSDPVHALGLRRVRLAAEEAKIELSRAREASLSVPGAFTSGGAPVDLELTLTRARLEALLAPLVDRSLRVCARLLAAHGLAPGALSHVVLVGGPTVTPLLRERVCETLGVPIGENLDPMTLVAQGAAIYAATANLDARPASRATGTGRKVWLQYPAMTSDLSPHVVGRVVDGAGGMPATVAFRREPDGWKSPAATVDAQGAFVASVELVLRKSSLFTLEGLTADGTPIPLDPPAITVMHGLTIGDPPLSRSIGVALANDEVQVYVERGAPLPAKRRFVLKTVETVAKGPRASLLRIPIVQGEFRQAHLCRLVGTLEISGAEVGATLPSGSAVEVTLELDRGGRLGARAFVPALDQLFEEVAHLLVPDAPLSALEELVAELRSRVGRLQSSAFREARTGQVARLAELEGELAGAAGELGAARGGDQDAAQKARRILLEIDATLEELEGEQRWPEALEDVSHQYEIATSWAAEFGTAEERRLLEQAWHRIELASAGRDVPMVERQRRLIRQLGHAAYFRWPYAWDDQFDLAASRLSEATNLPRARELVEQGERAKEKRDLAELKRIVHELWPLLPADVAERKRGFDSGVR